MNSFKSSGDIQKKEGGPDSCFERKPEKYTVILNFGEEVIQ